MKVRGSLVAGAALAAAVAATAAGRGRADIDGEVAVVTGASRGLGLLLARELARHGCPLIICARDGAELERAAADLRARDPVWMTVPSASTASSPSTLARMFP